MKKKVATLLVIVFLGSTSLYADEYTAIYVILGVSAGLTILGMIIIFAVTGDGDAAADFARDSGWASAEPPSNGIMPVSNDSKKPSLVENKILQHVSFGATDKQVYLGAHFSY